MTKEEFALWINTDEGKSIVSPFVDNKITGAIKTYQQKHPIKDNLGERLDEFTKIIDQKENELKASDLRFFAYKRCIENNIDYELLEGFNFDNEENLSKKIIQLATTQSKSNIQTLHEKLASGVKPQSGQQRESAPHDYNYYLNEAEERDRKISI